MRLFRGAAEAPGFCNGTKVAELTEFHRLRLSIVSELDIGIIGAQLLRFVVSGCLDCDSRPLVGGDPRNGRARMGLQFVTFF